MTATPLCSTCGQLPASGSSLQRCSRCKSAYYCSKACQKAAWKLHKLDCRGGSSSALATPNISMPGSPTNGVSEVTYREGSFDVAIAGVEGEKDGEMEGVEVQG
ncbi:hypothetical protein CC80DRAFT_494852 [Byssothecium circinans]|uniref:MYND-type domain-containing protein n=1 Tax=Byssothecium circinans TaxID=147558 RepID=A0A6A5TNF7_9PLEO|nr:hypothetical protein CC80DRAFT_494852 [Byssothecium circinans]